MRVTLEIAQLAGKIEGEQAAKGIVIALPDLLIGVTALHLGYSVATLNSRHFRLIPELSVVQANGSGNDAFCAFRAKANDISGPALNTP